MIYEYEFPFNICNGYGMPTLHKGLLLLRSPDPNLAFNMYPS